MSAYGFGLTPSALAKLEVPTLVAFGGSSHPAVKRANELLGQCIPGASVVSITGASHFMIATHAAEVAAAITQHVVCSTVADGVFLRGASTARMLRGRLGPIDTVWRLPWIAC
jgi:hypothetical protein